jgi:hypothetical protein
MKIAVRTICVLLAMALIFFLSGFIVFRGLLIWLTPQSHRLCGAAVGATMILGLGVGLVCAVAVGILGILYFRRRPSARPHGF